MKLNKNDDLIAFQGKPDSTFYFAFIGYAVLALLSAVGVAWYHGRGAGLRPYFYIDFCTAIMIGWFLAKSFRTQPFEKYVTFFRVGLFILFNCLLVVLAAGLELTDSDIATLVVSVLFVPAMILVIFSFNDFISFVNDNYKSAVDLSLTDELTGLPNRRAMNFMLREFEKKPATLCIIDIDHFKKVNDSFGHETGDKVLIAVGLTLNEFIDKNVFIARSGGEEFCIIFGDDIDTDEQIVRIRTALTLEYNKDIRVTVSGGVAVKRRNENFTSVMIDADEALYRAKREGRNCFVFADSGRMMK